MTRSNYRIKLNPSEREQGMPLDGYTWKDFVVGIARKVFDFTESHIPYEIALRYQEPQIRKLVGEAAEDCANVPARWLYKNAPIGFSVDDWYGMIDAEHLAKSQLNGKKHNWRTGCKSFQELYAWLGERSGSGAESKSYRRR